MTAAGIFAVAVAFLDDDGFTLFFQLLRVGFILNIENKLNSRIFQMYL